MHHNSFKLQPISGELRKTTKKNFSATPLNKRVTWFFQMPLKFIFSSNPRSITERLINQNLTCGLVLQTSPPLDTECMLQTQTVIDRHRLSVTETECLWQTQTVVYRHRLSFTDTDCRLQTQTVCSSYIQSVSVTDSLCQTQTVCDRHRLSVIDTNSFDRQRLSVRETDFMCQKLIFLLLENWLCTLCL